MQIRDLIYWTACPLIILSYFQLMRNQTEPIRDCYQ